MVRLGILGSTRGSNLTALIEAQSHAKLVGNISVVISNKQNALILEKAKHQHIPSLFVDPNNLSRSEYDRKISAIMRDHQVDLIVLIGYMRILSAEFVAEWPNKIINVHPSLLPAFSGMMDLDVHRAVLHARVKESGCTVHYVTAEVDAGPIVLQKKCSILPGDTPESLKERVQQLEAKALIEAINQFTPA